MHSHWSIAVPAAEPLILTILRVAAPMILAIIDIIAASAALAVDGVCEGIAAGIVEPVVLPKTTEVLATTSSRSEA